MTDWSVIVNFTPFEPDFHIRIISIWGKSALIFIMAGQDSLRCADRESARRRTWMGRDEPGRDEKQKSGSRWKSDVLRLPQGFRGKDPAPQDARCDHPGQHGCNKQPDFRF